MLAAVFDGTKLEVKEVDKPEIGKKEALMKVEATAICGTDQRIIQHGHKKISEKKETILGHEFTGNIVEVGSKVNSLSKDDRITIAPNIGCGKCEQCLSGNHHRCPDYQAVGINIDGGFAQYFRIPQTAISSGNVIHLPPDVPYEQAVLAEPLGTCFNALQTCGLRFGNTILIIGAGPMGILNTILAEFGGASKIILSEVLPQRRRTAKKFGADRTINPNQTDLPQAVKNTTDGKGVDISIVAAPVAAAQVQAIKSAAIGGRVHFFGTLPQDQNIERFPSNTIHYRQIYVTGSSGASTTHLREVLQIIASEKLPLSGVITHEFSLQEMDQAIEISSSPKSLKVIVRPN